MTLRILLLILTVFGLTIKANAQLIKNDFMDGIAIGEIIEKGMYDRKNSSIKINQWNLSAFYDKIDGYSPEAVAALYYPGYIESKKSNAVKLKFLREGNGSCHTGYSLTNKSEYNSGAYYLAFMINVAPNTIGGDRIGGFLMFNGTHTSDYKKIVCSLKKADDRHFFFGLADKDLVQASFSPKFYEFEKTYLVVMKYDFTTKKASLYINPSIVEKEPQADITITVDDQLLQRNGIRAITLRQRSSYDCTLGGLRFASSWKSAVGLE